jgi:GntR family transcriptional regulator
MQLKKGPIPLYLQLERILRKKILTGSYEASKPFPTDMELCRMYGVSRITVRQALKLLEDDGLIRREQGRGTFVTDTRPNRFFYEATGSFENDLYFREDFRATLASKRLVKADAEIASDLAVEPGEKIYLFEGTQALSLDQKRFQLFKVYVPRDTGQRISKQNFKELRPFIQILNEVCTETVARFDQIISAAAATEEMARILKVEKGFPLLAAKNIFIAKSNRVLGVIIRFSPADSYQIIHKLKFKNKR